MHIQIDPRHRYGLNLHRYYDVWYNSESSQPFFYWYNIDTIYTTKKCSLDISTSWIILTGWLLIYFCVQYFKKYRLDIGEGKEVNAEKCSRSDLQSQCITYLGPVSLYCQLASMIINRSRSQNLKFINFEINIKLIIHFNYYIHN